MSSQELAEKCVHKLFERDSCSQWIGIEIIEIAPRYSKLSLTIGEKHLNGHNICHGGIIFSLADTAFAFAANSQNQSEVSLNNQINYLRPATLNDTLIATARVVEKSGKTGIYDVSIVNDKEEIISEFRGISREIKGQILEASEDVL